MKFLICFSSSFLPLVIELCPLAVCQTNMLLETHQFIILLLFSPFLDRIMSASSMLQCSFPFGRQMEGPMGGEGPPGCPFPLSTHTNYCTKFYCKVNVNTYRKFKERVLRKRIMSHYCKFTNGRSHGGQGGARMSFVAVSAQIIAKYFSISFHSGTTGYIFRWHMRSRGNL